MNLSAIHENGFGSCSDNRIDLICGGKSCEAEWCLSRCRLLVLGFEWEYCARAHGLPPYTKNLVSRSHRITRWIFFPLNLWASDLFQTRASHCLGEALTLGAGCGLLQQIWMSGPLPGLRRGWFRTKECLGLVSRWLSGEGCACRLG